MLVASIKGHPGLGTFSDETQCLEAESSEEVESPGKSTVARTASYPGCLELAAGCVLGHTDPVEERGRRLRGRYVWGRSRA